MRYTICDMGTWPNAGVVVVVVDLIEAKVSLPGSAESNPKEERTCLKEVIASAPTTEDIRYFSQQRLHNLNSTGAGLP